MIRALRRKFILIAMLSLLLTLALLCTAIGVGNRIAVTKRADRILSLLHQNDGGFPAPELPADPTSAFDFQITQETPFETRYVIVSLTENQEVCAVDVEHIAALDRQSVVQSISDILASGDDSGYSGYYRFGVFDEPDGGSTVIMLDCFLQIQSAFNMLRITLLMSGACAAVVFVLLVFFSKKAIAPFAQNLEKQRQFVTDASHELKTPLAILSADVGLLEDSCGQSRWLESARTQISRMDTLIQNLMELVRTEETVEDTSIGSFCVSDVAQACADAFEPLARESGKTLSARIDRGVCMRGVQDNLFRLFSILLDNAVKYCDAGGEISFSLYQKGKNVCILVSNPCADVDAAQMPRYFDRFYRADSSRARSTGGYGIGLSTAKAIVERHRGKISSRYTQGTITFCIEVAQSLKQPPEKKGR